MSKLMSKTVEGFLARVVDANGTGVDISRAEFTALRAFVLRYNRDHEYRASLDDRGSVQNQLDRLVDAFNGHSINIDDEWGYDGLAWLWANRRRMALGERQLYVMRRFNKYTLRGFDYVNLGSAKGAAAPIWRVWGDVVTGLADPNRDHFDYVAWPWQSGVKPHVIYGYV